MEEKVLLYYSKSLDGFHVTKPQIEKIVDGAKVYYYDEGDFKSLTEFLKAIRDWENGVIDPRIEEILPV